MPRIPATTPLRSARLRRIVAAYTINRTGTWFGFIALAVAVFDHTHSAIAVAALFLSGQVLPAVIVQPLVARVEASARRGALTMLYLFEAAMTAGLAALLAWHFQLEAIFLLVMLDGTAALAANALLRAAAARSAREWADARAERSQEQGPRVAAEIAVQPDPQAGLREAGAVEAERRANAALNVGFAITFTLGPPLAGVAVSTLGAPATLVVDVISFVICGVMLIDIRSHVADGETASIRARVEAAWRYIMQMRVLRMLLITETVALTFFEFSPPIEVAYAKVSLHAGDKGYGLLLGVWGLGVAVGSIVFARSIKRSLTVLLSASTLAVGLAYLGWAAAPTLAVACAAGLIGGIGNGVQWAALISAVQRLVPEGLLSRLMGTVESMDAICAALGFVLGGTITALSTARTAFLVAGLGATLCTIAFVRLKLDASPIAPAVSADALETSSEELGPEAPSGKLGAVGQRP
jgi:predicted MFS family arabinose efflux permease